MNKAIAGISNRQLLIAISAFSILGASLSFMSLNALRHQRAELMAFQAEAAEDFEARDAAIADLAERLDALVKQSSDQWEGQARINDALRNEIQQLETDQQSIGDLLLELSDKIDATNAAEQEKEAQDAPPKIEPPSEDPTPPEE
ncbi:MAG: hypothetical protein AAF950_16310 [Pseudomonadota bacterium]